MKNKAWKTKLSFSVPMTLAALLNPALSQAGTAGGWDCISANHETYFNFLEPKLGATKSSHVLEVGGYDGHYIDKSHTRDFRSYGDVTDTYFKVKIIGPMTPSAYGEEATLGYLEGSKDANGQWHATFTPIILGSVQNNIPLTCKY